MEPSVNVELAAVSVAWVVAKLMGADNAMQEERLVDIAWRVAGKDLARQVVACRRTWNA